MLDYDFVLMFIYIVIKLHDARQSRAGTICKHW